MNNQPFPSRWLCRAAGLRTSDYGKLWLRALLRLPGLPLFPRLQPVQPADYQPAPLVLMLLVGPLPFGFPLLPLRFDPQVLRALKNSSAHGPYRTQGEAIRGEIWDFDFHGVCFGSHLWGSYFLEGASCLHWWPVLTMVNCHRLWCEPK